MSARCPGKERFVKDARDLSPSAFRRLVAYRARRAGEDVGTITTEDERREVESQLEKVHREADFLPVQFLADGSRRADAVCRIRTATSFGTGFLIAQGILMTNNHVIASRAEGRGSFAEFDFQTGRTTRTVAVRPEQLFITDESLDFTIVGCDAIDGVEPIPLLRNPALVTRHERVSVIQHPDARRKEVALHDNRVERVMDKVIRYRTDTEPGSSGSPVFNNLWDLIALHHAGFTEDNGEALNEGIRISAIVSHLLARGNRERSERESISRLIDQVRGTSPQLGFFDLQGLLEDDGQEVVVDSFTGTREFCDVGFWNIEHFNDGVDRDRVDAVADVLAELSLDIIGLTEVQEGALQRLSGSLARRGIAAGVEVLNVPGSQDLAVLFDRDTTNVSLRSDLAQRYSRQLRSRTSSGRTVFPRHPLFAEVTVADDIGRSAKFLMIVVHLKAFGDAQSRERRRKAAEILANIIDDIREKDGFQIVLGGDFNERLDNDVLNAIKSSPDLISLTLDDATGNDRSAITFVGDSHRSLIDHVVVSGDVQLGDVAGDDAAIVRLDRNMPDFADTVSDHVPVAFRMVFRDVPVSVEPDTDGDGRRIEIPAGSNAVRVAFEGSRTESRVRRRKKARVRQG